MSAYQLPTPSRPAPPSAPKAVGYTLVGVLVGAVVVGVGALVVVESTDSARDGAAGIATSAPMLAVDLGPSPTAGPLVFVLATEPATSTPTPRPKARATSTPYPICQTAIPGDLCVVPMPPQPTPTPMPACGPGVAAGSLCMWREPTP